MINLEKARELLKAALETQGRDFIYAKGGAGCYYKAITEIKLGLRVEQLPEDDNRRKTGCFIGVALSLAGETRHLEFPENLRALYYKYPDMMTEAAMRYFMEAQVAQDAGYNWGYSYDKAESSVEKGYIREE